ncbi:MAG TPA: hypothetical protein ACFYDZ_09740 [Candidatus Brocadiaceae bacterium]
MLKLLSATFLVFLFIAQPGIANANWDLPKMYKTPFNKIDYLTSQTAGIGSGRPGTEEFLNADVIIKLKDDDNFYGFSLSYSNVYGPDKALFDTLMAAFIYNLSVEITYYEKAGTKQIVKVTVKK